MITQTVMRRVLAKLEAEDVHVLARTERGSAAYAAAGDMIDANRRLQAEGVLIARLAKALNFETRGVDA